MHSFADVEVGESTTHPTDLTESSVADEAGDRPERRPPTTEMSMNDSYENKLRAYTYTAIIVAYMAVIALYLA